MPRPAQPAPRATPGPARDRNDSCPGALSLHQAADGALARIRLPGGQLTAEALHALADICGELGDGRLELTSRGNLQLRGIDPTRGVELAGRIAEAGLLPSLAHERVRNIVASPLSGLDRRGRIDVSSLVTSLDRRLCGDDRLTRLPGRFLFALDDGRRDLDGIDADIRLTALDEATVHLQPGDITVPVGHAAAAMILIAEAFLAEQRSQQRDPRHAAWRISELDDGARRVADRARPLIRATASPVGRVALDAAAARPPHPLGLAAQRDARYSLTVLVALGRLEADQARRLAELCGGRGLRITPWRSIVLTDIADPRSARAAAARAGLGIDATSPWLTVSACTGRPGCAKAFADVQGDARRVAASAGPPGPESPTAQPVAAGTVAPGARPPLTIAPAAAAVHWSGCARRCGRPADTAVDVLATENGYVVCDANGQVRRVADPADLAQTVEVIRRG
jgi:precorrin-3B synthase